MIQVQYFKGYSMKKNYLAFIPKINDHVELANIEDKEQLLIKRNKKLDKIIRFLFKTPEQYTLELDELGLFVIKNINGTRTIGDISNLVKDKFGEVAEPIIPRIVQYFNILKSNDFINFIN